MGLKHDLKRAFREAYARVLFHSGLCALVDRMMPRRFTILAGHCVSAPSNAGLPGDMKIDAAKLESILTWLAAHFEMTSVGAGARRIGEPGRRSLVALSMDDGYVDNVTHLLPLLARLRMPATVYLESRPLDQRRLNWSHKLAFVLERLGPAEVLRRYVELARDPAAARVLSGLADGGVPSGYHIKRALKYEVDPSDRNRVLDTLFLQAGCDERALCDGLYMSWDGARTLRDGGVELGGHTVQHEILSRLDATAVQAEVEGSRAALKRELDVDGESFAYPFGRNWDFHTDASAAARAVGFRNAVTTHSGTNGPNSDRFRLKRVMIDEHARLHLIAAEACGGFDLLRKVGIDLSE